MDIQESISQLMELIDALSSTPNARSVVALSLSHFFRREYSSVYDAIDSFFQPSEPEKAEEERRAWEQKWMRLIVPYLPQPRQQKFWLFGIDVVPIPRPFARTLPDCTFVYQPNTVVKGNKPVTIGHQRRIGCGSWRWPSRNFGWPAPWQKRCRARGNGICLRRKARPLRRVVCSGTLGELFGRLGHLPSRPNPAVNPQAGPRGSFRCPGSAIRLSRKAKKPLNRPETAC